MEVEVVATFYVQTSTICSLGLPRAHGFKKPKEILAVIWLDIAKAYPSVPHQLVKEVLEHYHVRLIDGTIMQFTVGKLTKACKLEICSAEAPRGWY